MEAHQNSQPGIRHRTRAAPRDRLRHRSRQHERAPGSSEPKRELPADLEARLKFFRERAARGRNVTSDVRDDLYATIMRLRHLGVPSAEVARRLGMTERNLYYHVRRAKAWFGERMAERLDPLELLADEFTKLDMIEEPVLAMLLNDDLSATDLYKIAAALSAVSNRRVALLDKYGYFKTVNFHDLQRRNADSAEARFASEIATRCKLRGKWTEKIGKTTSPSVRDFVPRRADRGRRGQTPSREEVATPEDL